MTRVPAAISPPDVFVPPPDRVYQGLLRYPWLRRIFKWEFWPAWLFYAPVVPVWLYYAARARNLLFFTAANPDIAGGGMVGETKFDILERLPAQYKPITRLFAATASADQVRSTMDAAGLDWPVAAKPNVGQRGWRVRRLNSPADLAHYLRDNQVDFLLQEFVQEPLELAVLYVRYPGQSHGRVTSIAAKEYLAVTGDGNASLRELILRHPRAPMYRRQLWQSHADALDQVLPAGQTETLVHIGNHCRGARFINANALITPAVLPLFDEMTRSLGEVWFCRFDLKCRSPESLKTGRHIYVMEINGVGADPAHIYDSSYPLLQAYRDIAVHWRHIYRIATKNTARGFPPLPGRYILSMAKAYRAYCRLQKVHSNG
jgi:hypothetical protein